MAVATALIGALKSWGINSEVSWARRHSEKPYRSERSWSWTKAHLITLVAAALETWKRFRGFRLPTEHWCLCGVNSETQTAFSPRFVAQ